MSTPTFAGYTPGRRGQVSPSDTRVRAIIRRNLDRGRAAENAGHADAAREIAASEAKLAKFAAKYADVDQAHRALVYGWSLKTMDLRNNVLDPEQALRDGADPRIGEFLTVLAGRLARGHNMTVADGERVAAVRAEVEAGQLEVDPDVEGLLAWAWAMLPFATADGMRELIKLALAPAA